MSKTNNTVRKEIEAKSFRIEAFGFENDAERQKMQSNVGMVISVHDALLIFNEALRQAKQEVLEEILLGVVDGHTPDFILDNPDGRIKKAYEKLMKPMDFSGGKQLKNKA